MSLRHTLSVLLLSPLSLVSATFAQRLPANAHPEHYRLALTPDLTAATFSGEETIDLTLDAPSATITLNAIELKIGSVTATTGDSKASPQIATISYDIEKEQATFTFPQPLAAGKVSLALAYTGVLNDKLRGFYLSKTKARNYAVTQFESTDARRAFPSFDEPALKATYDIALTVDTRDTVISNTNIISDEPTTPGRHLITFATTPRMSTYLVAFLVGDFVCTKGKADGVPIRGCATPDKVKLTRFAVQSAEYILHYYDTYFGIKYPMPKLDMIALPDFEAGAMENFGAITYRETDLLLDSKHAPIPAKKRVASVVAHEMAHQWFGDMVTMQWWDNLWLNEGFATWMELKPIAVWHPEWNFPQDAADDLNATLNSDSQTTTRTIRAEASTPAEINEMFDGIAYGKGGAVIGMVEHYLGEELFRQGVHNYLQAHLYANATAEDFWNAQTATSHRPVDKIMASFVTQPGVPLLTLSQAEGNSLPVAQSRFYIAQKSSSGTAQQWTIPVCLKGADCQLLSPDGSTVSKGSAPFVFANADSRGYYRTAYTPSQVAAITAVAETALTPPERIDFVGDTWSLMRSGRGTVGDFLNLALALKNDPNSAVLDATLGDVGTIEARIADEEDRTQLETMMRREFSPVYAALGKGGRGETFDHQEIRGRLFQVLGAAQDPEVLAQADTLAQSLLEGHKSKDAILSDAAVGVAAGHGDAVLYDKLLAVTEKATDPGLKAQSLTTLARFRNPSLVERTLEYAASGKVRNQDSWVLFSILLQRPETRDQAWTWIRQNWDKVAAQFTASSGSRVVAATGSFCTVQQRDEVTSFFAAHHVASAERTLKKATDAINDCIDLRHAQEPQLKAWLLTHSPTAGSNGQAPR